MNPKKTYVGSAILAVFLTILTALAAVAFATIAEMCRQHPSGFIFTPLNLSFTLFGAIMTAVAFLLLCCIFFGIALASGDIAVRVHTCRVITRDLDIEIVGLHACVDDKIEVYFAATVEGQEYIFRRSARDINGTRVGDWSQAKLKLRLDKNNRVIDYEFV